MADGKKSETAPKSTGRKPPGTAWKPGQSGNPEGRKPGTRNRATVLAESILEKDVEEIARVVTDAAKEGDLQAARLVIERLVPPRRERPIAMDLPEIKTLDGVSDAQAAILQAVAAGELLPTEGTILSNIVEQRRKSIETQDLEQRIAALEQEREKK